MLTALPQSCSARSACLDPGSLGPLPISTEPCSTLHHVFGTICCLHSTLFQLLHNQCQSSTITCFLQAPSSIMSRSHIQKTSYPDSSYRPTLNSRSMDVKRSHAYSSFMALSL